jgi:aminoglycoside phosphotransferase (APT) family kinase protein
MELPVTIIHGEFYASNILVDVRTEAASVRAVDWEMAGVGPGLVDLAALAGGNWAEDQRAQIARAYWEQVLTSGANSSSSSFDEFMASLDLCRLQLAIQWLGWSSDWVPPPQQTHDWMAEAIHLIERVEI